ncbi:MAG: glycosyltransferase family 2 protein [Patescibacteria group bacterium]
MISVIIPTKNGSQYIGRAIKSVLSQTETDLEIIVINDASTDNTANLVTELQQHDARIRLITNKTSVGPGISRHVGIRESKSEFIALIDDDDEWLSKEKLSLQKKYLDEHPRVAVVGSAKNNFVREDGSIYPVRMDRQPETDAEIRRTMLWRNPFITSSVMLKKDPYLEVGGFSPMYLAEDYDLWMRLGHHGELANIHNCDINYMIREGSASTLRQQEMNHIILGLVKNYKNDYPRFYYINLIKAYARIWLFDLKHLF